MITKETIKIKTTTDQIAGYSRKAIFSGKFLPGSRLKENEISEWLGVSRTPIREAFRILESEGLVEINSNKGVQIPLIKKEELDEVCELRILLEVHCIRKYIKMFNENDFQKMEDIIIKTEYAINQKDYFFYFNQSINFHVYLMSHCKNELLYSAFLNARNSIRCAQMVLDKSQKNFRDSINYHKEILQAIKERDLDRCVKLMRQHLDDNCEMMKRNVGKKWS